MQVTTKRSLGGIFLLVAIVSFWCFLSGFEQPWTDFHMALLITWPIALALAGFCLFTIARRRAFGEWAGAKGVQPGRR